MQCQTASDRGIAISAFGDSTIPMFISKNKTFDEVSLAAQQLSEEHPHCIKISSLKCYLLTGYEMCSF
jgi:hypothetical protein